MLAVYLRVWVGLLVFLSLVEEENNACSVVSVVKSGKSTENSQ